MTPKQRSGLYYLIGKESVMEEIARRKYLEALRAAYQSRGISEKRKEFRRIQAVKAGLLAKMREV